MSHSHWQRVQVAVSTSCQHLFLNNSHAQGCEDITVWRFSNDHFLPIKNKRFCCCCCVDTIFGLLSLWSLLFQIMEWRAVFRAEEHFNKLGQILNGLQWLTRQVELMTWGPAESETHPESPRGFSVSGDGRKSTPDLPFGEEMNFHIIKSSHYTSQAFVELYLDRSAGFQRKKSWQNLGVLVLALPLRAVIPSSSLLPWGPALLEEPPPAGLCGGCCQRFRWTGAVSSCSQPVIRVIT